MRLIPLSTSEQVGHWAAEYIAKRINDFHPTAQKPFVLGLPTGSTPLPMYRALISLYQAGKVSFKHVVTFNMDEYVGLPPSHPESYHYFMQENFFKRIDIPAENVNLLNGMADNPQQECLQYEEKISQYGKIHLFIGGVGTNGHIAFNEPFSSLTSRTHLASLTQATRQANSRFFNNDISLVPKAALTVGIGTLLDAEEVLILATGENKAYAVQAAVEGNVNHQWTVSALQLHPNSLIVCDEPATFELKVKTVNYFKMREQQ